MASTISPRRVRDPERTQERLLAAALTEFASKGFAGARVDAIARAAGVNKRMLYHYFGHKHGLFRAVLLRKIRERSGWADTAPLDPGENLAFWFDLASRDRDWIRLLQWEGLQGSNGKLVAGDERRAAFRRALARLRDRQAERRLAPDLDLQHTMLTLIAVTTFPLAFPQITRLVTGHGPTDRSFRRDHAAFLRRLADALRGPGATAPAPSRNGSANGSPSHDGRTSDGRHRPDHGVRPGRADAHEPHAGSPRAPRGAAPPSPR
jgi:AcrR family transcriptional regulator